MKTTAKTDIVNYVLGLFATLVLLVSWPRGKKGGPQKWTKITAKDMADPAYLEKLAEGNIGVIMGPASGGIGSLDIDDDAGAEEFLALNPDLKETLRTRGARGCNIWFYPDGEVPASCKLKRNGQAVVEGKCQFSLMKRVDGGGKILADWWSCLVSCAASTPGRSTM